MTHVQASFYIPRISISFTEKEIIGVFDSHYVGYVKRVDFVPLVQNDTRFHSAFVHCYHANQYVVNIIEQNDGKTGFKLTISPNEFWILLKNKNPILETRLNIHQIVENARLLEERVLKQDEIIKAQTEQIDRIQENMYQLIDLIFDPREDKPNKSLCYDYLMKGRKCTVEEENEDSQKTVFDHDDYEYEQELEEYDS